MSFVAKIILDSLNPHNGIRLTTMELTYPRFIHQEIMTHRLFSRNAASSRAIPIEKTIKAVKENPAMPVSWGKNRKGMSATKEIQEIAAAQDTWLAARDKAVGATEQLAALGLHKQVVNRILEPFVWMTIICSATNWSNFFALRDHPDAQPEISHLARLIKSVQSNATPVEREWHLPFIQEDEQDLPLEVKQKVSTARCARVSYLTHDGKRSLEKDLELHDRLLKGSGFGHWSAFEHVAKATNLMGTYPDFTYEHLKWFVRPIWCGNFQGWIQYRKTQVGECQ